MSFADTVVLFVLALLLFGPKKLPMIARQIGKALNEFKRASNEFKAQIESEISQLEYEEKRKKEQAEPEQKILPPAAPPVDSVESSGQSTQHEASQNPIDDAPDVTPTATSQEVTSPATPNINA
jgi:sec-independent protein translocase protein TatB